MLGHYFSILLRRQECLGKGMWEVIVSKRMERTVGKRVVGKILWRKRWGEERDAGRGPRDRYVGKGLRGKGCVKGIEGKGMCEGD